MVQFNKASKIWTALYFVSVLELMEVSQRESPTERVVVLDEDIGSEGKRTTVVWRSQILSLGIELGAGSKRWLPAIQFLPCVDGPGNQSRFPSMQCAVGTLRAKD